MGTAANGNPKLEEKCARNLRGFKRIVSDLNALIDVKGVAIINKEGTVIAGKTNNGLDLNAYIQVVLQHLEKTAKGALICPKTLFLQSIVNYNGSQILYGRIIDDILLVILLEKKAYLGLAMLDLENSAIKAFETIYT
jgi:predicted regulator of Ras-like GTPase activity (Roadblock/LC7/MglB family)